MSNKPKKNVIKISTIIDSSTRIEGNIFSENNLKIDGCLNGNLHSTCDIVVSETGIINGNITANSVVVHGIVTGNITTADTVTLSPKGRIEGDVQTVGMIADIGSSFQGRCQVNNSEEILTPATKYEIKVETKKTKKEDIEEKTVASELLAQVASETTG